MKKLSFILLLLSLVIGFMMRFYLLGKSPNGIYVDEAIQGYSAFSILQTGLDEFGKPFPIVFRSLMDFKTPIYTYLSIPFIKIFGLNPYSIRLVSAIFSFLTIPVVYLLIRKISPKPFSDLLAGTTSLLLAISPWHIFLGRSAFEVTVATFFLFSGLYFFYTSIRWQKNKIMAKHLSASAITFAVCIMSYHAMRVVVPVLVTVLLIKYRKILLGKSNRRSIVVSTMIGFTLLLPTLFISLTPGFWVRASLNIFSGTPAGYLDSYSGFASFILNSKIYLSVREFVALYLSYFSPKNMFILGDSEIRMSIPGLATFYLWQLPFFAVGFYKLLTDKKLGDLRFLTLVLLVIIPIPAALTRDPYSTIRSLPLVVPQLILVGLGVVYFYSWTKSKFSRFELLINTGLIITSVFVLIYSISKFWSSAAVLTDYYLARYWQYGWKEVVQTLDQLDESLPVVVDNARGEPYAQILFFSEFDPTVYRSQNDEVDLDKYYDQLTRDTEKNIGNIITRPIDWNTDLLEEKYLVGDNLAISDQQISEHDMELVEEILYPDRSVAFRIVIVVGD